MIAKQRNIIIISAIVFVALLAAYFAVIRPLVNKVEPAQTTAPAETKSGEVIGAVGRVQMFEQVERSNIKSIEVHNSHGEYTFYRDDKNSFVIKGHEGALYDATLFSSLVTSAGYTLSMVRVVEDATPDMWKYGLAESDNPAWYKLTTMTGVEHTVYIGKKIPSQGGYYVRYAGRDTVYVLDSSLETTLLSPIEAMVTPLLAYPTSQTTYFSVDKFMILHGEDLFIKINYVEESKRTDFNSGEMYKIVEPAVMGTSLEYDTVLQSFINFSGSQTVKLGITDEALEKYGLNKPAYTLYYVNNLTDEKTKEAYSVENMLMFSAKNADGSYYVASPMFDIIAKIEGITANFLEWDMINWVKPQIFQININEVAKIEFESAEVKETFILNGQNQDLVVTEKGTGHKPDVKNFRQLYKMLLSVYIEDYASLTEEQAAALVADKKNLQLKMTVILNNGKTRVYEFYPYSERRSLCLVDGEGSYYTLRTIVNKVISDVIRVMNDQPVISDDRY